MAVEAGHFNLLPSQLLTTDCRGFIKHNQANMETYNTQMDSAMPLAMTVPESLFPYQQSNFWVPASAKTSMNKSDCTGLSSSYHVSAPRKRPRDFINELTLIPDSVPLKKSYLEERCLSQIQQQQCEMDRFIAEQAEKVRLEIEERRAKQLRMLAEAIQRAVLKKMKEKDDEIQRIGKLNWVLQERVSSLCMENQIWRELAHTNEATANSLRTKLQQILAHYASDEDAAESSCGSNDIGRCQMAAEVCETSVSASAAMETAAVVGGNEANWGCGGGGHGDGEIKKKCKKCGERESSVLLLPCRHLCLCKICGSTMPSCPVCDSVINASLHVNFS